MISRTVIHKDEGLPVFESLLPAVRGNLGFHSLFSDESDVKLHHVRNVYPIRNPLARDEACDRFSKRMCPIDTDSRMVKDHKRYRMKKKAKCCLGLRELRQTFRNCAQISADVVVSNDVTHL